MTLVTTFKIYLNSEFINQTKSLYLRILQTTALNRWGKPVKTTVSVTGMEFLQAWLSKELPKGASAEGKERRQCTQLTPL